MRTDRGQRIAQAGGRALALRAGLLCFVATAGAGAACTGHIDADGMGGGSHVNMASPARPSASPGTPIDPRSAPGTTLPPPGQRPADSRPPVGTASWPRFACSPGTVPPPQALKRLTARQYRNSVEDLVTMTLDAASAMQVMAAVRPALDAVPEDPLVKLNSDKHGTFRRLAQDVQQGFVDAAYDVAVQVGAELTRPPHLPKAAGACATGQAYTAGCVEAFIRSFGARALRGPLNADEVELYKRIYGDLSRPDPAAFADVIGALLAAPRFLYVVEHGDRQVAPGTYSVTPYELASRLSFHFWDRTPDERLRGLAMSGQLADPDVYRREVDRVLADPRTRPVLDGFFREWLLLEELPALDRLKTDKAFLTFAAGAIPSSDLRRAMAQEMLDMGGYFTWDRAGNFDDLLTTDLTFAKTAELARKIYGLGTAWDGKAPPPRLEAVGRPGYLTRAAMLATGDVRTAPISRGALLRQKVLCDEIPPPPPNAMDETEKLKVQVDPNATTRQRYELLTESEAGCRACHIALINPLGWAFEGFDSLGRARSEELIINLETGALRARVRVDTSAVPQVVLGDARPARDVPGLVELIRESGKAHACLARHYVRFTYGRIEDLERDGCALGAMMEGLKAGAPLSGLFRQVALTESFRQHSFGSL